MAVSEPVRGVVGLDLDRAVDLAIERWRYADAHKTDWDHGYLQAVRDAKDILNKMHIQSDHPSAKLYRRWYDRVFHRWTIGKKHARKADEVCTEDKGEVGSVHQEHGPEAPQEKKSQEKTFDPF